MLFSKIIVLYNTSAISTAPLHLVCATKSQSRHLEQKHNQLDSDCYISIETLRLSGNDYIWQMLQLATLPSDRVISSEEVWNRGSACHFL